jgi:NADH:ubiquinone oxidoreductase subunit 5 (subunit L)/multisubunit Na+/H+ antiporter MnhA subunit
MESYAQLVPLMIFVPFVGAIINYFWGARLGEFWSSRVAIFASALTFVIALLLFSFLGYSHGQPAIVDPPFLDGWIRMGEHIEIPWQMRVDTLSVTMMLFVSFVGTLIHIYAAGYMHGDPRFPRFFAYINMFLAFMFILVTGNNFLMMFVGWEGVGVCSFLLIGFWFDKAKGVGWKNSNAARKAMIANRVGDFGMLMAIFLLFWTFGTLDYFKPGEIANVHYTEEYLHEEAAHEGEAEHSEEAAPAAGEHGSLVLASTRAQGHGEEAPAGDHGEAAAADDHGAADDHASAYWPPQFSNNDHIPTERLGVFGQAERLLEQGAQVHIGPFVLSIETVIVLVTLFLLLGATGKSAQIPLFVWLPDAMAGPTPVSALIHAATMVTAGVYMMVRSNVLFVNAELTSFIVTVIGAATAIVAGYIALGQWDIKRVLAYSTISQLGFMVAAVGVGAFGAAIFHMVTHAFFKALLFLGSGSVIHGVEHGHHHAHAHHGHDEHDHDDEHAHHEEEFDPQDMRNMGGLRHRMPITYWTYLIGTLALAGIFPFAGFWSKDEILADSWLAGLFGRDVLHQFSGYIALALLLVAAGFTAFYMWRQMELVFYGEPRTEAARQAPESVRSMTIPLLILAVFSIFIGFINTPKAFIILSDLFGSGALIHFLEWSVANVHPYMPQGGVFNPLIAIPALAIGLGGIFLARSIYGRGKALTEHGRDPLAERPTTAAVWSLANARLYWDEFYFRVFENPFNRIGAFLADRLDWDFWHDYFHNVVLLRGFNALGSFLSQPVDLGLIDGAVNGVGRLTRWFSSRLRRVQTGYVRMYAITVLIGVVFVIVIILLPMIQAS